MVRFGDRIGKKKILLVAQVIGKLGKLVVFFWELELGKILMDC